MEGLALILGKKSALSTGEMNVLSAGKVILWHFYMYLLIHPVYSAQFSYGRNTLKLPLALLLK